VEFYGGAGNDTLRGGDGDDLLDGGSGNDNLDGGDGDDLLRGRHGDDNLSGGPGDDVLYGDPGRGQDTLSGDDGDDTLFGADGDDDLRGGDDDDTLVVRDMVNGDEVTVDGDRENDTLDLGSYADNRVSADDSQITIDLGDTRMATITHSGLEAVLTGEFVGVAGPDQTAGEQTEVILRAVRPTEPDGVPVVVDGSEFQVNTLAQNDQEAPSIAIADNGAFVIVWQGPDADRTGVFAQLYDAGGVAVGGEIQVNATTSGAQTNPVVAIAGDGGFVVAWESPDTNRSGVLARRFGADGVAIGGEFQVNLVAWGDQKAPAIAMASDGRFVIAWQGVDANRAGVYAQRYDANGVKVGGRLAVNTVRFGDQDNPAIAMADDGRFTVVWEGSDSNRGGIFARQYSAIGVPVTGELTVNSIETGDQINPAIAMSPDGRFVVAWQGSDSSRAGVFAQRFDAAAGRLGDEFQANTSVSGDQAAPAIVISDSGRFVILWQGPDADRTGVFAQAYFDDGQAVGREMQINATIPGDQIAPAAAMTGDGYFAAVWESPDDSGSGVFARRYNAGHQTHSWTQLTGPAVVLLNADSADPSFVAPDTTTTTALTFELEVFYGGISGLTDTVTVTVSPNNDAPEAIDDPLFTDQGVAVMTGDLLANDTDPNGDMLRVESLSQAVNGLVVFNGNGRFTYTPNPGYSGDDSFTYTATDGNGGSDTAAVNITVSPL